MLIGNGGNEREFIVTGTAAGITNVIKYFWVRMEHQTAGKIYHSEKTAPKVDMIRRTAIQPQPRTAITFLHRAAGNRAVGRLFQAKLVVGEPSDQYEQEADQVAEQVMRMPELPKADSGPGGNEIRSGYFSPLPVREIQRQEEEEVSYIG